MKAAILSSFGKPEHVVQCIDIAPLDPPAPDELTVAIDASPINPSDLLHIAGNHFQRPSLPLVPGGEGVGHVIEVGRDITSFKVGDRVVPLTPGNWIECRNMKTSEIMRVPTRGSVQQYASLRVNPATAYALCNLDPNLGPGDWIIQNAGNSAVGLLVIRFAREKRLRTVNIVRRAEAIEAVADCGGDVILLDGEDLPERARQSTNGAEIRYGIDAIGGRATLALSRCLTPGGQLVVYGLLSGDPCLVAPEDLIAKGLMVRGFRLKNFFEAQPSTLLQEVYGYLAGRIADGEVFTKFERIYPLSQIKDALAHAQRSRSGKILLVISPQETTSGLASTS